MRQQNDLTFLKAFNYFSERSCTKQDLELFDNLEDSQQTQTEWKKLSHNVVTIHLM